MRSMGGLGPKFIMQTMTLIRLGGCYILHSIIYIHSYKNKMTVYCLEHHVNRENGLTYLYEPRYEKTGLRGFRPGLTQTRLRSHRRWLEAGNFVFRKQRDCIICVAKTKALISFAVTAKLICVFVFPYAKSRFSHGEAHIKMINNNREILTFIRFLKH